MINALAQRAPTVICLEDLHWADPSSLELIRHLFSEIQYPMILLCVYRPTITLLSGPQIKDLGKLYREIYLQDLSPSESQDMIESILKTRQLPLELKRFVQDKIEVNPFYIEEVVNSLIESEILLKQSDQWRITRNITETEISSSIHGVIASRLDRLETDSKRLLQEASVIGRGFFYEILQKITSIGKNIDRCLSILERLDWVKTKSIHPDLEYIFKHALTREVVYNGLLIKERRLIHEKIGAVMESLFQDRLAEYYETLAFHIKNSRLWGKAVEYLIKSGQKCLKRYSVTESHQYFSEAFTILNEVSDKTKKGGVIKAKEAYELYLQFRPDGVIAADDNAQSMFVLPYLKDKVETPVMFCAVNEEPEIYGYPASNVSGILERNFIKESIAFAKQLVPSINRIGFLVKDSPSGYGVRKQVEGESDLYLAEIADFKLVKTIEETLVVHKEYDKISDALFISATNGILDAEGKPMDNEQVTRIIAKLYNANFRDYGFEGVIEKPYRIQDMSDVLRSFYGDEKSKG